MKCIASGKSLHKLSMSVIFDSHYMDSMTTDKLKYFFSENYTFSRMDKDVSYVIVIENNLLKKGDMGAFLIIMLPRVVQNQRELLTCYFVY